MALQCSGFTMYWLSSAAASKCNHFTVQLRYKVVALQSSGSTAQWLHNIVALYSVAVLQCSGSTMQWLYNVMALQCSGFTVFQCVVQCSYSVLQCVAVLQLQSIVALQCIKLLAKNRQVQCSTSVAMTSEFAVVSLKPAEHQPAPSHRGSSARAVVLRALTRRPPNLNWGELQRPLTDIIEMGKLNVTRIVKFFP